MQHVEDEETGVGCGGTASLLCSRDTAVEAAQGLSDDEFEPGGEIECAARAPKTVVLAVASGIY